MQTQPLFDLMATAANRYSQLFGAQPPQPRQVDAEKPVENDDAEVSLANFQNLKFDFFYEKVVTIGREATFLQGDEARSISQNLYQKVSGRLSFDFSILSTLAEQTGRAANIDEDTFKKFVEAANGLASFEDDSLNKFLETVDELFNAAEQALGLSSDGLDDFADLLRMSVKEFFTGVTSATESLKKAEKNAAKEFGNQLQALLNPPEENSKLVDGVRNQLAETDVSERLRSSLLTIAKLLSRLSRAKDPERQEALLNRLQRVTDRAIKEAGKQNEDEEDAAAQSQALQVQQYTETVERFSFNIEQSQLSLFA
jgi:hypothetical protein